MAANPYASFVASLDVMEQLRAMPVRLENFLQKIAPEGLGVSPAPGKWSPRDILCHLADTEIVFAFRLRQTLAQDNYVIQPFDQDKWAATYDRYDARTALATFSALRQWNLSFIAGLRPDDFTRSVNHPERGDMTLRTIVETMAGHDLNHLRKIETLVA